MLVVRGDPTFAPTFHIWQARDPLAVLISWRFHPLRDVHMNYQVKAEGPPAGGPDCPGTSPPTGASLAQRPLGERRFSGDR